jgi:hypothetical protein
VPFTHPSADMCSRRGFNLDRFARNMRTLAGCAQR